jgi:hypothetical protein
MAATTPTTFPSGTSTYTWASGAFTSPTTANGWSLLPGASSAGFTLYGCQVVYVDNLTTATSTVTWTTSTAYAIGAAGANGANGTNGTNGANGANGIDGLSSRICYAKSTSSSLNPTPATYTTTGVGAFPPTNTWGGSETWQATPPALTAGEALFQSDGIFNPATTQTVWNVPYLSNLKVGSLSAITANLGTITSGSISGTSLTVGSSPAVSGTTMTGSGAIINSGGTFALGDSSTNISYNGSQMSLNGNVVATGNINSNAVTVTTYTQLNSIVTFPAYATGDALSVTINTGGQPVLMIYSFYVVWGSGATTGGNQFLVEMKIDGVAVKQSNFISISSTGGASFIQGVAYLANPSSGNFNVSITLTSHVGNFTVSFYPVTQQQLGTYFYVLGTKR